MIDEALDEILEVYDKTKDKVVEMADKVLLLDPKSSPLMQMMKKLKGGKALGSKHTWLEDDLTHEQKDDTKFNNRDLDDILGVKKKEEITKEFASPAGSAWTGPPLSAGINLSAQQLRVIGHQTGQTPNSSAACPLCGCIPGNKNYTQIHQYPASCKKPKLTLDEILDEEI